MKVLVLGASGMLGNAMCRILSEAPTLRVTGTVRSASIISAFPRGLAASLLSGIDVENQDQLARVFAEMRPDVVVNCVGVVKQLAEANDPLHVLPINAMLPHRLARLCELTGARLVHVSTDCVFSGSKGGYLETDRADATDLYGMSKYIGEVAYPHTITLRTSIIGHELVGNHGLIGWFLAQEGRVKGYTKAIFSGLPTVELARLVRDLILPRPALSGVYHVAAAPIAKYDLLREVAMAYGKTIDIEPDDKVKIDRSLNAERLRQATGYVAPSWTELIARMRDYHLKG